jgi:hypothetical protein
MIREKTSCMLQIKYLYSTKTLIIVYCLSILGASVRPSFSVMEKLGSYWVDFDKTRYLSIFGKPVEKFRHLLKSCKNSGYFT